MQTAVRAGAALAMLVATGCSQRVDPDLVAVADHVRPGSSCPVLEGRYALLDASPWRRVFPLPHGGAGAMATVALTDGSGTAVTYFRLAMDGAAFEDAVAHLRAGEPQRYRAWRTSIAQYQQRTAQHQEVSIAARDVSANGPLPEWRGVFGARQCEAGWALVAIGAEPRPGEATGQGAARYSNQLWIGRNARGDLVYRIDRYRLRDVLGHDLQTSREQRYGTMAKTAPGEASDWTAALPPDQDVHDATPGPAREDKASALASLSQDIQQHWPAGSTLTRFVPEGANAASARFVVHVQGRTPRASDVRPILAMLQARPGVAQVELVSLRTVDAGIEFATDVTVVVE